MIGWLIFAVVVIAIVGWRVVGPPRRAGEAGFFRRSRFSQREALRKITAPPRRGAENITSAYSDIFSGPIVQW